MMSVALAVSVLASALALLSLLIGRVEPIRVLPSAVMLIVMLDHVLGWGILPAVAWAGMLIATALALAAWGGLRDRRRARVGGDGTRDARWAVTIDAIAFIAMASMLLATGQPVPSSGAHDWHAPGAPHAPVVLAGFVFLLARCFRSRERRGQEARGEWSRRACLHGELARRNGRSDVHARVSCR